MQSPESKGNSASSTPNTSAKRNVKQGRHTTNRASDQKRKRSSRNISHHPQVMFSDPLDSPSSDAKSFDEDDMYGSDADAETISLGSGSKEEMQSPDEDTDANVIPELESLEMDMRDLSVMVKALCEGQGIDVTSIARETQGQSSHVTSPNNTSDTSLELHGGNGGNDG